MGDPKPDPNAPLDSPEELESEDASSRGLATGILRRVVWTGSIFLLGVAGWYLLGPL